MNTSLHATLCHRIESDRECPSPSLESLALCLSINDSRKASMHYDAAQPRSPCAPSPLSCRFRMTTPAPTMTATMESTATATATPTLTATATATARCPASGRLWLCAKFLAEATVGQLPSARLDFGSHSDSTRLLLVLVAH